MDETRERLLSEITRPPMLFGDTADDGLRLDLQALGKSAALLTSRHAVLAGRVEIVPDAYSPTAPSAPDRWQYCHLVQTWTGKH